MRAAVYHGPRDVRVETRPRPRAGPDQLLVEVSVAAICGTDASEYVDGPHLIPAGGDPIVLGHEFTGRVVELGAAVAGFALGDRIVSGAGVWCGECDWCRAGRTNLCAGYFTLGLQTDGGLAELVAVTACTCVHVPDGCPDAAAALAQPLAVALHALERADAGPGESIVVIGAGGIGAFIVAAAADQGAFPLVVIDIDVARLRAATALGASHVIDAAAADAVAMAVGICGEGAHVVIEASGVPDAAATALRCVRRGGRIVAVGLAGRPVTLDLADLSLREVELRGTVAHVCARNLPTALDILTRTDLAERVAGSTIALEELVEQGLAPLAEHRAQGKILIDLRR